jgi:hypothetical protein
MWCKPFKSKENIKKYDLVNWKKRNLVFMDIKRRRIKKKYQLTFMKKYIWKKLFPA